MFDVRRSMFGVRCSMFNVQIHRTTTVPAGILAASLAFNDMKHFFTLIIIAMLIPIHAPAQDPVVGSWGGKWDDTWPVFLSIETNSEPNTYKVHYRWMENLDDSKFSTRELIGYKTNNYVHAKFLDFRMTGTNGMLYGEFKNPRMANLVRLTPSYRSVENTDELLRQYGWTENSIPAREAFKKITGP